MKAVVAAFNQEKALVGAFSVLTNLWMEVFQALVDVPVVVGEGEEGAAAPGDGARQPHHAAPQQTLAVPQRHLQLRHRVRRAGEGWHIITRL